MKQAEIKNLSVSQLQEQLIQLKKAYINLKQAHSLAPIENPIQIKTLRRTVARIHTEITKREEI